MLLKPYASWHHERSMPEQYAVLMDAYAVQTGTPALCGDWFRRALQHLSMLDLTKGIDHFNISGEALQG